MSKTSLLSLLVLLGTAGCFSSSSEGDAGPEGTTAATLSGTTGATVTSTTGITVASSTSAATTSAVGVSSTGTGVSTGSTTGSSIAGFSDAVAATSGSGVSSSSGSSGTTGFGNSVGVAGTTNGGIVATATASGTTGGNVSSSSGSTTGGGIGVGSFCVVPQSGASDPCFSVGLSCIGPSPVSATGTCQLPPNGYACEESVGCATGNECYTFPGNPATCYQTCTQTTDCAQTYETCQDIGGGTSFCIPETCGPGSQAGGAFYQPCDVVGVNDGFCVPFSNAPNPDYGLCIAGAPVDAGLPESCSTYARGDAGLCPIGMFCYTDYETTGTQCQPFCGVEPVNGEQGPACDAGQFCVQSYGAIYGSCAPTCPVPDQSSACSSGENCLVTGQLYGDGGSAYTCEP